MKSLDKYKIAIRAGHGANDPGATNGIYKEKEIALKVSKALNERLLEDGHFDTLMIRKEDEAISIKNGAEMANSWGADFYLSIHLNSFSDPSANGAEIYYKTEASKAYAEKILQSYLEKIDFRNRGVLYKNNLKDLNYPKMPAALLELGFISNPGNLQTMISENYPERAAEGITKGICNIFGVPYEEGYNLERIERLEQEVRRLEEENKIYNWTLACPDWAIPTVQKLLDLGYLKGNEKGELGLSEQSLKVLVINDRAGLYQ